MKGIFGSFGGAFAGLCCAGTPLILAFLTGIGLGFLINDFILFPLLFIFLGFMFYSLYVNKKKHKNTIPIIIGIISTIILSIGIFYTLIIWFGVVGLFIATIWDYFLIRKSKKC